MLDRYTDRTPVTLSELFAELEQTLAQGYATSDEDITPGIGSLGAPDLRPQRSASGLRSRSAGMRQVLLEDMREEAIEMLVEGAREISAALGHASESGVMRPLLEA